MSVIALASLIVTQAPINLIFSPKVGATYKYTLTTKSNNPMTGANDTTINSTLKVLSFANGQYKVQSKFEGGSAKAGTSDLTMLVDKYGTSKMSGGTGPKGMEAAMSTLGSSATGINFPKKAIKVGETWTQEFDLGKLMNEGFKKAGPQGSKMNSAGTIKSVYKLMKVTATTAEISAVISGTSTMSVSGMKSNSGPSSMNMKMKISGTGTTTVERSTGLPLSSIYKSKMAMNVMNQSIDTVLTNTYKRR